MDGLPDGVLCSFQGGPRLMISAEEVEMPRTAAVLLLLLGALPLTAGPLAAADRYLVDAEHSRISFSVPYDFMILGELEGEFREFSGEVVYQRSARTASTVWIDIVTASVDTYFEARDIGLRGDEYLAVETYPIARFHSTAVEERRGGLIVRGELTMHGISRPVEIDCDLLDLADTLVVNGRAKLSREAFGVSGPDLSNEIIIGNQVSLGMQLVLRRVSAEG